MQIAAEPDEIAPRSRKHCYNYRAHDILRMLNKATQGGGNLLLNIGPAPDGSVPPDLE
ncbi:MAG: alpha-L-fucosidase, partial [Clostridiales bacterium]|nr:alpha-L-fucosidase [Clostridiales bacterium]